MGFYGLLRRREERRPICGDCGEPIQGDQAYRIDGDLICPDCLERDYLEYIDDDEGEDWE
jgi:formylmethanofuran dehydrogenase subunit E